MKNLKECFNYKQIFEQPTKIRKLGWFTFTNGIVISRFVLAVVVALLMYLLFNGLILFINSLMSGLIYVIYTYVPYKVSGWILAANTDGQRLDRYLLDLFLYLIQIAIPKRAFCQDEIVESSKEVIFEEID